MKPTKRTRSAIEEAANKEFQSLSEFLPNLPDTDARTLALRMYYLELSESVSPSDAQARVSKMFSISSCTVKRCPILGPGEVAIPGSIPSSRPREAVRTQTRKQYIVVGCQELLAPTMWRSHMTLHAKGIFPGAIPNFCLWSKNEFGTLWNLAKNNQKENRQPHDQAAKHNRDLIAHAISLGRAGLFGKACKVLESNGLAPNNDATWQLLQSKHPSCPPPVAPNVNTIPISVGPGFDILSTLRSLTKGTAAGPSGLRMQHLLDAALIPIATPICATLRDIVNLLASGKAPPMVAKFLAGGTLIALNKLKDRSPPDIRPIAVGESLRRHTGKCICALVKDKASDLFQPLQLGVACSSGSEKIIPGLRKSIKDHWMVEDFVVYKIDMQNAFNLVSRQAVLDECATSFPELLPMGYMVLWLGILMTGVLTGRRSAVLRALSLIEELGPSLGTHINLAKCEFFSHFGNSMFPPAVKFSHHPNLEILGAPIGDYLYCSKFVAGKCADARKLLSSLVDVAARFYSNWSKTKTTTAPTSPSLEVTLS
eukprot:Em0001g2962a